MSKGWAISLGICLVAIAAVAVVLIANGRANDAALGSSASNASVAPALELYGDKVETTSYGSQYIVGRVINNTSRSYPYVEVRFKAYDRGGSLIGSAWDNVSDLGGHEQWSFRALAPDEMYRYEFSGIYYRE